MPKGGRVPKAKRLQAERRASAIELAQFSGRFSDLSEAQLTRIIESRTPPRRPGESLERFIRRARRADAARLEARLQRDVINRAPFIVTRV